MSYSHIVRNRIATPSGEVANDRTYSASGHAAIAEAVANGETAKLINIAIDVSTVKAIVINSDQDSTIKTNSSGAPDDTLAIPADAEYSWNEDSLHALKLTVDVTKIYVANASGATANLTIDVIQDATP